MHYWNADASLTKTFAPVLGVPKAWDVYLLYDKDAEWTDKPPKPIYWQEQLGISDETQLDADKMSAKINELISSSAK